MYIFQKNKTEFLKAFKKKICYMNEIKYNNNDILNLIKQKYKLTLAFVER